MEFVMEKCDHYYIGEPELSGGRKFYPIKGYKNEDHWFFALPAIIIDYYETLPEADAALCRLKGE